MQSTHIHKPCALRVLFLWTLVWTLPPTDFQISVTLEQILSDITRPVSVIGITVIGITRSNSFIGIIQSMSVIGITWSVSVIGITWSVSVIGITWSVSVIGVTWSVSDFLEYINCVSFAATGSKYLPYFDRIWSMYTLYFTNVMMENKKSLVTIFTIHLLALFLYLFRFVDRIVNASFIADFKPWSVTQLRWYHALYALNGVPQLVVMGTYLKGAFFPHSWEDINPEINCSQMFYSARIYQLMCIYCIHTINTVEKLHWQWYNIYNKAFTNKIVLHWKKSNIFFLFGCKLRKRLKCSKKCTQICKKISNSRNQIQGYLRRTILLWSLWIQRAAYTCEPRHEKTCLCHMRTRKAQISLRIRAVWSAPLLFAV